MKTYDAKIEIRISQEEKRRLKKKCLQYHLDVSKYVRQRVLEEESLLVTPDVIKITKELINEINHVGNNINQIVKNVNSHFYSDQEKKDLAVLLFAVEQRLEEVLYYIKK